MLDGFGIDGVQLLLEDVPLLLGGGLIIFQTGQLILEFRLTVLGGLLLLLELVDLRLAHGPRGVPHDHGGHRQEHQKGHRTRQHRHHDPARAPLLLR